MQTYNGSSLLGPPYLVEGVDGNEKDLGEPSVTLFFGMDLLRKLV
jgi:hypothetical protein